MRILFVQAISTEATATEMVYPIGLVTLASMIKEEYEVEILDLNVEEDPYKALKEKLMNFDPSVTFISLRNIDPLGNKMTSLIPQFGVAVKMLAALKPEIKIIAGGTGFSLFPKRIMEMFPEISFGIIGEGENSILQLLHHLENPIDVKGLCYRKSGMVHMNEPSKDFRMDVDYVVPDRDLVDVFKYQRNTYVQSIGVETKRGCPYSCSYCVYPNLQGKKLRCRDPKEVVDEVELLNKKYGIKRVHFTDPVVNIPAGHMESICQLLINRDVNIKWSGFFREDMLNEYNADLFVQSGCECFSFSPDGLTDKAMDVLEKNMTVDDVKKAVKIAAKTEIVSVYHFMINIPGENEETLKEGEALLNWIYDEHSHNRNLGTIVLNNIRIYPNTPICDIAIENGVVQKSTNLLYPTYYNPEPYSSLRYELEAKHLCRNVFMWQEVCDL